MCSKLDEDTQLALALSVSAADTTGDTVTADARDLAMSPSKDSFSMLMTNGSHQLKRKKKARSVYWFVSTEMTCIVSSGALNSTHSSKYTCK